MQRKFNKDYEILTPSGWSDFDGIQRIINKGQSIIKTKSGLKLKSSFNHKVKLFNGEFKEAKLVIAGDIILDKNNESSMVISNDLESNETYEYYDVLEVKKDNEYYTNGLVSHNCEFIGSSNTLVSATAVEKHLIKYVIDPIETQYDDFFEIFEKPNPNKRYVLGVDPSKGLGQDYSIIQVLDITNSKDVKQVAIYRNNMINPIAFAQIVKQVSIAYNEALTIIENNGEMGGQLIQWLFYELEFENIVSFKESKKAKREKGIRATRKSKFKACMNLRDFIDNDWITLRSKKTCEELLDFEEVNENIFKSASGHDDTVTSLYWGLFFIFSNAFDVEEFTKFDESNKVEALWKDNNQQSEESFGMFGIT